MPHGPFPTAAWGRNRWYQRALSPKRSLLPRSPPAPGVLFGSFLRVRERPTWDPSKLAALREWPRPTKWSRFLIGCPSLARAKLGRLMTAPLTELPLESCATTSSLSPLPLAHWYSCNEPCRHVSGIIRSQPGCESEAGREVGTGTVLQAEPRKVFPFSAPLFLRDPCPALTRESLVSGTFLFGTPDPAACPATAGKLPIPWTLQKSGDRGQRRGSWVERREVESCMD